MEVVADGGTGTVADGLGTCCGRPAAFCGAGRVAALWALWLSAYLEQQNSGALLWLYPFFLMLAQLRWPLICILAAASVSALEELAIQCRAVRWEPDRRSLWDMPGQRAPGQEKRV